MPVAEIPVPDAGCGDPQDFTKALDCGLAYAHRAQEMAAHANAANAVANLEHGMQLLKQVKSSSADMSVWASFDAFKFSAGTKSGLWEKLHRARMDLETAAQQAHEDAGGSQSADYASAAAGVLRRIDPNPHVYPLPNGFL
eukprot:GEMP01060167.1.p1 GENE.GEMP01060167.1~~GEMP01060167.1.p1  ORF type:complete len:141 (+),score=30.24 GEMP01060167.1:333-755(+)